MANANNPFGFALTKSEGKECRVKKYIKAAGAIYPGDVVKLQASGDVVVAAAGDVILGVAAEYVASAGTEVLVYDDPEAEFMVQCSGTFALADIGLNADIVANSADSTLKMSNHALDLTTKAVTSTLQFKIVGFMSKGENEVGASSIVRVKPNAHQFKAGNAGI